MPDEFKPHHKRNPNLSWCLTPLATNVEPCINTLDIRDCCVHSFTLWPLYPLKIKRPVMPCGSLRLFGCGGVAKILSLIPGLHKSPQTAVWLNFLTLTLLMWRIGWAPNNASKWQMGFNFAFNPLNPELNPICYLLALLGAQHFLHVSRIRVKLLTFRWLM